MGKDLKFSEYPFRVPNEKKIVAKCEELVKEITSSKDAESCAKAMKKMNKFSSKISTMGSLIYVKYSLETTNKKYKKAQEKMDEISPVISNYGNMVAKFVTKAPFRAELEKKFGAYLFQMYDASLKAFDEKIIPDMIEENKLSSQYEEILGGAQIEFNGEVLNLSQLGKYMQDKDGEVRKAAAIKMDEWLGANEKAIADIYDKLVHLRDGMAKKLGFKNFVELGYLRLGRTDYDAKMVAGYRAQIARDVVPLCQKLYKIQMKNLGIKNPQYYDYNLMFKSGNPMPAGDEKYLVDAAHKMYSALGAESKEFFELMMSHELLDLTARKGKTTGGYCTSFAEYKVPFIFSNFNGTSGDVNVLTHEGGHAFQYYLSRNIKVPEYVNPTLESCEIHSMSMEFFAWPYMEAFFGKDAEKYKYSHLADSIEFLPYGISIDEFQHWVYENPNATHEERCAKFHEIESRYEPHKKYDFTPVMAKGTRWMRQGHVFGTPFYYIDYTLAQVCAFQFANENLKDHDKTWKKYVKLCKCGGKYPFLTLLAKNHIRNPFVEGTVKKAIKPLEKVLKEFDTSKF